MAISKQVSGFTRTQIKDQFKDGTLLTETKISRLVDSVPSFLDTGLQSFTGSLSSKSMFSNSVVLNEQRVVDWSELTVQESFIPMPQISLMNGIESAWSAANPSISFYETIKSLDKLTGNSGEHLILYNRPIIDTNNIPFALAQNHDIYLEMVILNTRKPTINSKVKKGGDESDRDRLINFRPGRVQQISIPGSNHSMVNVPGTDFPYNNLFQLRGSTLHYIGGSEFGFINSLPVNFHRANHLKLTSVYSNTPNNTIVDQYITIPRYVDVAKEKFLDGRFSLQTVSYNSDFTTSPQKSTINLYCPTGRRNGGRNHVMNRRGCGDRYQPLLVAFRYVIVNPYAYLKARQTSQSMIITGPLSKTIQIGNQRSPFSVDYQKTFNASSSSNQHIKILIPKNGTEIIRKTFECKFKI